VPHFEQCSPRRSDLSALLALPDGDLIRSIGGRDITVLRERHRGFSAATMRSALGTFGLHSVCVHDAAYPPPLAEAPDRPAALFVAGAWERFASLVFGPSVAVVGARRASGYGLEAARALGRELAAAGVTVVSGMALGVDSSAHAGALEAGGATVAVLAGSAHRPVPREQAAPAPPDRRRGLRGRGDAAWRGSAALELPPPATASSPGWRRRRSWSRPRLPRARSSPPTARGRSGATSARVPGQVTSPLAAGPNDLLFDGALVVRGAGDVLDLLFGASATNAAPPRRQRAAGAAVRAARQVEAGRTTLAAIVAAGGDAGSAMVAWPSSSCSAMSGGDRPEATSGCRER
jgi:DNA processing protein